VALVRAEVSEERIASIMRITRIGLIMEVMRSPKRRFLQEPHGITSQKTAFFGLATCLWHRVY
jgi:hypothetical protein